MNLRLLSFGLLILISLRLPVQATLFYPAPSALQVAIGIGTPLELNKKKFGCGWGVQMSYQLPNNIKQFYNAPIWPGLADRRKRRDFTQPSDINMTLWHQAADLKYGTLDMEGGRHTNDFTAGELYHSFENLLVSYGFHETCLLRSVCELAHHPFAEEQHNILTDILTFLLTPSIHEGFSSSEQLYGEAFEVAERRGFLQHNCTALYNDCKYDLLTLITKVVTNYKHDHNYVN